MTATTLPPQTTTPAPAVARADAGLPERIRRRWAGMSGKLGMGSIGLGFALMLVAWNGAAGLDYTQGQLPYVLSAGLPGLGFVILGAALLVVENARRDRAVLERLLTELVVTAGRTGAGGGATSARAVPGSFVLAGRTSFHDPACKLASHRDDAHPMSREDAEAAGLAPCRVCSP